MFFPFARGHLRVFSERIHENRPRPNQLSHRRLSRQRETHPRGLPGMPRSGRGSGDHAGALAGRLPAARSGVQIAVCAEMPASVRLSRRRNPRGATAGRLCGSPSSSTPRQAVPQCGGMAGTWKNPTPRLENAAAHLRRFRRATLLRTERLVRADFLERPPHRRDDLRGYLDRRLPPAAIL